MQAVVSHFGEALRRLVRERLHMTLREFSRASRLSLDTLNRAMKMQGIARITPATYRAIADSAGMTAEELDAWWQAEPSAQTPSESSAVAAPALPTPSDVLSDPSLRAKLQEAANAAGLSLAEFLSDLARQAGELAADHGDRPHGVKVAPRVRHTSGPGPGQSRPEDRPRQQRGQPR